jgi:type III pantothenate kinase
MTLRYFGFPALVVEPGVKTGIAVLTDNPKDVGADRVCNAVAAHYLFPGESVVIVDFGTAIKVEALTAKGEFLGGAIAPGMETAAAALFSAAARLTRVELTAPPGAIGRSTVTALQSGIIFGTAALVDGLVQRVVDELGGRAKVIATGGLAGTVMSHCKTIEDVEPTLTLIGLRLIFDRNSEAA